MIQIYAPGNTNFERNGDVTIQPSLCDLDMTLNGEWELEIEAPADEHGKFRAVTTGAVVAVPTPWSDKQLFRIYDHDTSDEGSVGLARPIFLDAKNEIMILDKRPTNCIGQEALDAILNGTKYKGKSNITKSATAYYIRKNAIQAIASDDENSFLNRWGGEIAYDNFTVTINERMGRDRGLRVEFGRNIKSIHDRGNSEELATRIYPVAYNGRMISGERQYVDSERIGDYPIVYSKILECQDIKLREDLNGEPSDGDIVCDTQEALDAALRKRCAEEYAAGADVLKTAYDVDMDDLSTKEEYAEYKSLEKVELGDTVYCRHRRLNIAAAARTVRLRWNCILRKNKKLYIGGYKQDYFARLNDTAQRLKDLRSEMEESEDRINKTVRDASERLDKALKEAPGLYCTKKDDGEGGTIIFLHDKRTLEESTNVFKVTADAVGVSTDGGNTYPFGLYVNGDLVSRILSAIGINADWINVGTINADLVNIINLIANHVESEAAGYKMTVWGAIFQLLYKNQLKVRIYSSSDTTGSNSVGVIHVFSGNVDENGSLLDDDARATLITPGEITVSIDRHGVCSGSIHCGNIYSNGYISCGRLNIKNQIGEVVLDVYVNQNGDIQIGCADGKILGIGRYGSDLSTCYWQDITDANGNTYTVLTKI